MTLSASTTPRPSATSTQRSTSASSSTSGGGHSGGLRAQIAHLLPRHALFHIRVHIHELSSVPLVSGSFAVRWRFKHVRNGSGGGAGAGGVFAKMRSGPSPWSSAHNLAHSDTGNNSSTTGNGGKLCKGKGKFTTREDISEEMDARPSRVSNANGIVINVVDVTPDERPRSSVEDDHSEGDDPEDHVDNGGSPQRPPFYLAAGSAASSTSLRSFVGDHANSEGRGQTPFVPLEDHTAHWDQTVEVTVQMGVQRDTGDLLHNEFKLVIMQNVVSGNLGAPRNPRLGAVYLNLAEYADKGPVTRKHLLRESKTNALLKLTIELEHVGGVKHYVAPPLRKGEVMAGITGLLASERLRSAPLPLSDSAPGLASQRSGSSSSLSGSGSTPSIRVPSISSSSGTPFASRIIDSGPAATRDLIESLFNPVPSADDTPSPFTYFDPEATPADDAASAADTGSVSEVHSMDTSASSPAESHVPQQSRQWWRARPRRRQTEYPELKDTPSPQPPHLSTATGSNGLIRAPAPQSTGGGPTLRVSSPLPMGGGAALQLGGRAAARDRPPLIEAKTGSEGFVTVTASRA